MDMRALRANGRPIALVAGMKSRRFLRGSLVAIGIFTAARAVWGPELASAKLDTTLQPSIDAVTAEVHCEDLATQLRAASFLRSPTADKIVWGNNVVWGNLNDDNIVWGNSNDDNIVWGNILVAELTSSKRGGHS